MGYMLAIMSQDFSFISNDICLETSQRVTSRNASMKGLVNTGHKTLTWDGVRTKTWAEICKFMRGRGMGVG